MTLPPVSPAAADTPFDALGKTPCVALQRVTAPGGARVLVKLEQLSLTGSAFDRVAVELIRRAEAAGQLTPGKRPMIASVGDLAISLAMVCAAKGYRARVMVPESVSLERRAILNAYGVEVELTPGDIWMPGARARAELAAAEDQDAVLLGMNPEVMAQAVAATVGAELVESVLADGGRLDAAIIGMGTGTTLAGVGRSLRARFPSARLYPVEAAVRPHHIQGLSFDPPAVDPSKLGLEPALLVSEREAWDMRDWLAREEGLLVSISSAANVAAAVRVAHKLPPEGRVYTLAWSTGERDFSLAEYFE